MIRYIQNGDIWETPAEWIVIPVNCKGIMGGGLALDAKNRYYDHYRHYQRMCKNGVLTIGTVRYAFPLVFLPTKDSPSLPSTLDYVERGLAALSNDLMESWLEDECDSIAIPALGCGLGGLDWKDVKPLIEEYLSSYTPAILVYEP